MPRLMRPPFGFGQYTRGDTTGRGQKSYLLDLAAVGVLLAGASDAQDAADEGEGAANLLLVGRAALSGGAAATAAAATGLDGWGGDRGRGHGDDGEDGGELHLGLLERWKVESEK